MGNWRTVQIVGGMLAEEVPALVAEIDQRLAPGWWKATPPKASDHMNKFGPLSYCGGLCGLPNWPAPSISAVGNLAERDYDPVAVADHLRELAAVAPSLGVMVHCGGDYEAKECIATVVLFERVAVVRPPQIATIGDIPPMQMENNLLRALLGPYNRTL